MLDRFNFHAGRCVNDVIYSKNYVTPSKSNAPSLYRSEKSLLIKKAKIMFYDGYHVWGMHLIWWFVWGMFLFWIFFIPYQIPGQRWRRYSPLDLLQTRLASGEITIEEYNERKQILEKDLAK